MPRSRRSPSFSSWRARVPSHWGERTWDALFLLAADFPHSRECTDDEEFPNDVVANRRRAWRALLKALPGVLTCGVCSHHFERYMDRNGGKNMDEALQDRESLLRWLYNAKDEVNRRNGRRSVRYERVRRSYVPACPQYR